MVDDTETAEQSHVNGHVVLSDSIHGRREERSLESNALGDRSVEVDFGGGEAFEKSQSRSPLAFAKLERTDVARQDQEIVVGETTVPLGINEGVDVDAIVLSIVLLQNLQGGGVVEHLSRRSTVDGGHFGRKKEESLIV